MNSVLDMINNKHKIFSEIYKIYKSVRVLLHPVNEFTGYNPRTKLFLATTKIYKLNPIQNLDWFMSKDSTTR